MQQVIDCFACDVRSLTESFPDFNWSIVSEGGAIVAVGFGRRNNPIKIQYSQSVDGVPFARSMGVCVRLEDVAINDLATSSTIAEACIKTLLRRFDR